MFREQSDAVKRLFAKASNLKPFVVGRSPASSAAGSAQNLPHLNPVSLHTPGLQPKYKVPPVPHPCPHEHLALIAAKSGLLIRPHIPGPSPVDSVPYVQLSWGRAVTVEEVQQREDDGVDWEEGVIVYGIVGILELFTASYLLVITSRTEVGNVIDANHTVYGVKGVSAIPLVEDRARTTLNTIASRNAMLARPSLLPKHEKADSVSSADVDDVDPNQSVPAKSPGPRVQFSPEPQVKFMSPVAQNFDDTERPASPQSVASDLSTPSSTDSGTNSLIAKTLMSRLSFWGRLSKRVSQFPAKMVGQESLSSPSPESATQERQSLEKIIDEGKAEPSEVLDSILEASASPPPTTEDKNSELENRIVRECIKEFTKAGMYFAYTFDITRSLQHKQEQIVKSQREHALLADLNALPSPESASSSGSNSPADGAKIDAMSEPYPTLPLWRRVDKRFWWNEWLSQPFIDAGLHSYVLPIMQGYYQVAQFNVPPGPVTHDDDTLVDYIIVSRRSRQRAGLRYQRRGIDDDAHVANFVETETIMHVERLGVQNIFSYVQIRGSIPLFWTQSGYSLKPPPLLATDRTHAQHLDALKRHFQRIIPLYGPLTVMNLAEQHGKEGIISREYREYMHEFDCKDARFYEYDFHTETRGMKYENIGKLIESMDKVFDYQGYLWISDNTIMSQQKGAFRINCIDCLDRTNVVQSAFARHILNKQLGAVALLNPQGDGRAETDLVFNDVWANNGDAISRAYAGTSALKGDFTRTGKRDLSGLLNDGVNSLARMYSSTFSDWFSQAVIDFMLGYRTISVFSEFLHKLQSTDPRDLIRLSKIRAEAIATSVSRVLPEGERLLSGWTLFSPEELNAKIGDRFEEKILLLSVKALYIISYDYNLEKVKLYTRVPLGDITGITKGAYILSPLEEASRDPVQNAGFIVRWLNSHQVTRVSSYSVRNSLDISSLAATLRRTSINPSALIAMSFSRKVSRILTNVTAPGSDVSFAAFKVLPIDPARSQRASSTGDESSYAEAADELSSASNCKEAVDLIVASVRRACEDMSGSHGNFVREDDIVSLAEAQQMTSVYAKMEYGVKRLLWLGS